MMRAYPSYGLALVLTLGACDDASNVQTTQSTIGGPQDTLGAGSGAAVTASASAGQDSSASAGGTGGSTGSAGDDGQTPSDESSQDDTATSSTQCDRDELACDGECIDPESDEEYCGAALDCQGNNAGERCRDDETCHLGDCVQACPGGQIICGRACIDPLTHRDFCGASDDCEGKNAGQECRNDEVCSLGRCDDECSGGLILCDGECIDPRTDADHCGARDECRGDDEGERCRAGDVCVEGRCADECPRDQLICDERCVDPELDPNHCGARDDCEDADAGEVCPTDEVCFDGRCGDTCGDDKLIACDRACIDPQTDLRYCGASDDCTGSDAGDSCDADELCVAGRCERAAGWGRAEEIEDEDQDVDEQQIAVDGDGNVVLVHIQDDHVYASRFDAKDERWIGPERIDSDAEDDCEDVQLGVDEDGNALVAWIQDERLWTQRYDESDERWQSSATAVQSSTRPESPSLALEAEGGRAVLVWVTSDTSNRQGIAALHFDGTRWGQARTVTTPATQRLELPRVAINADADALAVWVRSASGSSKRVIASRFELQSTGGNNGTWRTPATIDGTSNDEQQSPRAYLGKNGDALAVWVRKGTGELPYFATLPDRQTSMWSTSQAIPGAKNLSGQTESIRLVGTADDIALAAWLDKGDQADAVVRASMWDGSRFESAALVQVDASHEAKAFALAVNTKGYALAVWAEETENRDLRLFSNSRELDRSGGEWGERALAVEQGRDDVEMPAVCVDGRGQGAASWLMEGSSGDLDLWAAAYDARD